MTTKAERKANAERQAQWVEAQRKLGRTRIRIMAHTDDHAAIRAYAKRLDKARQV